MNLIILKIYSDNSYVCLFTANRTNIHDLHHLCFFSLLVIEFVITSIIVLIQLVCIQRAVTSSLISKDLMSSNTDSEIVDPIMHTNTVLHLFGRKSSIILIEE